MRLADFQMRLSRHPVRVARPERVLPWCEFGQSGGGRRRAGGGGGGGSGAAAVWHAVFWLVRHTQCCPYI